MTPGDTLGGHVADRHRIGDVLGEGSVTQAAWRRVLAITNGGLLLGATLLALWLRVAGLPGQDGTLSIDEARLALAARGILEHGIPIMPTGWIYTRGLLPTYLVAASFATLGQTDFAARVPSVLAGIALVPLMYGLGRMVAGRAGGLFAALFAATYPPLVDWSRQAWFYSLYVLLFAAAMLFILRAHRSHNSRDQLLAGLCAGLALFAHEFGIFLLPPLAAQVALRLRRRGEPGGWRTPAAALGLFAAAGALLALLALRLRADTMGGRFAELDEFALSPQLDWGSLRFYGEMLLDSHGLILAVALIGVPLAIVRRQYEALLLWLALLPPFLHVVTLEAYDRYGLTLMVILVLLAAQGAALLARWGFGRARVLGASAGGATFAILAVVLAYHLDVPSPGEVGARDPNAGAWLREARRLGIGRDDLVMTDLPTVVGWYLGDVDFWPRSRMFEKYTFRAGAPPREVHTGAVLVRDLDDYRRLVVGPNAGRTLWVLASGRQAQWRSWLDADLRRAVEESAAFSIAPGGSSYLQFSGRSLILRIDLPPGAQNRAWAR
ncbi:MAG: glycosyltransferase family 39 protein [Chloroflexota bacterium]|nr:glycosyltransferase family 39 protein [Chloroflexota bacterium]